MTGGPGLGLGPDQSGFEGAPTANGPEDSSEQLGCRAGNRVSLDDRDQQPSKVACIRALTVGLEV